MGEGVVRWEANRIEFSHQGKGGSLGTFFNQLWSWYHLQLQTTTHKMISKYFVRQKKSIKLSCIRVKLISTPKTESGDLSQNGTVLNLIIKQIENSVCRCCCCCSVVLINNSFQQWLWWCTLALCRSIIHSTIQQHTGPMDFVCFVFCFFSQS